MITVDADVKLDDVNVELIVHVPFIAIEPPQLIFLDNPIPPDNTTLPVVVLFDSVVFVSIINPVIPIFPNAIIPLWITTPPNVSKLESYPPEKLL